MYLCMVRVRGLYVILKRWLVKNWKLLRHMENSIFFPINVFAWSIHHSRQMLQMCRTLFFFFSYKLNVQLNLNTCWVGWYQFSVCASHRLSRSTPQPLSPQLHLSYPPTVPAVTLQQLSMVTMVTHTTTTTATTLDFCCHHHHYHHCHHCRCWDCGTSLSLPIRFA